MGDFIPKSFSTFRTWIHTFDAVIQAHQEAWNLPAPECTALHEGVAAYLETDRHAEGADATAALRLERREANEALISQVRFFVKKFINLNDRISDPQRLELGLHIPDHSRTPQPAPSSQAQAELSFPGIHLVELHIRKSASEKDRGLGVRIYYGIMAREKAAAVSHELLTPPESGDDLPHSVFTRKKVFQFDFPEADRGKWAYFCLRY
jgi:hypothetical protein